MNIQWVEEGRSQSQERMVSGQKIFISLMNISVVEDDKKAQEANHRKEW